MRLYLFFFCFFLFLGYEHSGLQAFMSSTTQRCLHVQSRNPSSAPAGTTVTPPSDLGWSFSLCTYTASECRHGFQEVTRLGTGSSPFGGRLPWLQTAEWCANFGSGVTDAWGARLTFRFSFIFTIGFSLSTFEVSLPFVSDPKPGKMYKIKFYNSLLFGNITSLLSFAHMQHVWGAALVPVLGTKLQI